MAKVVQSQVIISLSQVVISCSLFQCVIGRGGPQNFDNIKQILKIPDEDFCLQNCFSRIIIR